MNAPTYVTVARPETKSGRPSAPNPHAEIVAQMAASYKAGNDTTLAFSLAATKDAAKRDEAVKTEVRLLQAAGRVNDVTIRTSVVVVKDIATITFWPTKKIGRKPKTEAVAAETPEGQPAN